MTWFVLVSSTTFCIVFAVQLLGAVAWAVWDGMDDTAGERERLDRIAHPHNPYSHLEARLTEALELQPLLKRLAASRA